MHVLDALEIKAQVCNDQSIEVDPPVPNPPTTDDELLSDLSWKHEDTFPLSKPSANSFLLFQKDRT